MTTAVLWDLDGTLVDSVGDIADAANRTLIAFGLPALGEARVRAFIGDGARHLVTTCVEAAGGTFEPAHLRHFLADYLAHAADRTVLYPPALAALLGRIDAPQAVVTNKPEAHSVVILNALGLTGLFPVLVGGDTLPERKPRPEPVIEAMRRLGVDHAVLVGDGPQDVGAARAAGIPSVGVTWGIKHPGAADALVDDVPGLEAALRRLGIPIADPPPAGG